MREQLSHALLGEPYSTAISFYTEQLANPSVSSAALLVGRGIARILRGELSAARSDLEEAENILTRAQSKSGMGDVLAAMTVAAGLGPGKRTEADEIWRFGNSFVSGCSILDCCHIVGYAPNTRPIRWLLILVQKLSCLTPAPLNSNPLLAPWLLLSGGYFLCRTPNENPYDGILHFSPSHGRM